MSEYPQSDDFKSIVLNRKPLIDVRAPIEFVKGAFPHSVNLPLMNDNERHLVGIRYKEKGNAQAVQLGHELVGGAVKEERVKLWCEFIDANPDALLYCFRGGQRSKISQEWIYEAGKEVVRLKGGYKAFRNYLLTQIEDAPNAFKPIILGGRTGSGKTILLKKMQNSIDLEALANHRGSSFGRKITAQPTLINFENALAYDLIEKLEAGFKHLVFEDEGRNVGTVYMPKSFVSYLAKAPLVILETPMQDRIDITFDEYVVQAQQMYTNAGYAEPLKTWQEEIIGALDRIKKRIGGKRHKEVCDLFEDAVNEQITKGSLDAYKVWVEYLLREYYDPMYDYQIQKRSEQVVFRGSQEEVLAYLAPFTKKE